MTQSADVHNLQRFVDAQASVYDHVCAELEAGKKTTHWMWFVFPQIKSLGRSPTAEYFGIDSLAEAVAYWQHALLGPRLRRCTELVLATNGKSAHAIFGSPDDLKFRSSMTLFELAVPHEPILVRALDQFHDGEPDRVTIGLLR